MSLAILGIAVILFLMLFRLENLTPGISEVELETYNSTQSLSAIVNNPVNAPYKIAVFSSMQTFDSVFGLRLIGALLGAVSIALFLLVSSKLFSPFVAISTTALFGSSSLLLATARSATAQIMLLSLIAIITAGYYIRFYKRKDIGWIVAALIIGLSIYVPGIALFLLPAAIWQFKQIRKSFEGLRPPVIIISSVIFGILCVPLIASLVRDPSLWQSYLGLPENFSAASEILRNTGKAFLTLFVITPHNPSFWLGRQPVLDVFATIIFIYGVISLLGNFKLERFWIIVGVFVIGLLWIGVTANNLNLIILLPLTYVIVGFGLQRLINQWLKVFPKNPIARYAGTALLTVAIAVSANFQLQRYFSAWPNSSATKEALSHQLP